MSDHENIEDFFEDLKGLISESDVNEKPEDDLTSYYNPKVEMYNEEKDLHIVFHNVNEEEIESIKDIIRAFKGISNEYSEYFNNSSYEESEYDSIDETIGTQYIIPEGRYKGCTVQDAYNYHGHYSLSKLMQTILKMQSKPKEYLRQLFTETVMYALPRIQMKEIGLLDFIKAYEPFIRKSYDVDKIRKSIDSMQNEEINALYDSIVENITGRMSNSIKQEKE
jgi:hypothetical protein